MFDLKTNNFQITLKNIVFNTDLKMSKQLDQSTSFKSFILS